jgi:hypothetical protein
MKNSFAIYLLKRMPLPEVLKEHSELLNPASLNALFMRQAEEVLARVDDPQVKDDLFHFMSMQPVAYIDRSLRRAGIPDADLDEALQTIVVKFLVSPGSLFAKWDGKGPFTARFKLAVKNAVITFAQTKQRRARRFQPLPAIDPVAKKSIGSVDDPIRDFRNYLQVQYGDAVVRVFDHRLAEKDTKELIGQPGLETSYAVKEAVKRIKAAAVTWSQSHPDFLLRVARLMDQEKGTLAKRFNRNVLVGVA